MQSSFGIPTSSKVKGSVIGNDGDGCITQKVLYSTKCNEISTETDILFTVPHLKIKDLALNFS